MEAEELPLPVEPLPVAPEDFSAVDPPEELPPYGFSGGASEYCTPVESA